MLKWTESRGTLLRLIQIGVALVMLALAVDWVFGDGSQRAWLALLGVLLTIIQIIQRRGCE